MVNPGNLSSSLDHRVGFHFAVATDVAYDRPDVCDGLHLGYLLPHGLFVDPYELDLRSDEYTYDLDATPDLERPVSAVQQKHGWLEVHVAPSRVGQRGQIRVEVPIHARYGYPSNQPREEAYTIIVLPPPTAFWRCGDSAGDVVPLAVLPPAQDMPVYVPIGVSDDLQIVESGTALAVLLTFAYLAYTFYTVHRGLVNRLYGSKRE